MGFVVCGIINKKDVFYEKNINYAIVCYFAYYLFCVLVFVWRWFVVSDNIFNLEWCQTYNIVY